MQEELLVSIATILFLGVTAQWIAWKIQVPSILLLLVFGFLAGPVSGFLNPTLLFGDALFPIISTSVAIILFEGGLSLQLKKIPGTGVRSAIFSLISIGMVTTWVVGTLAAKIFLGLDFEIAVLLGAVLTVSGPTVILPLLRHINPKAPLGEILKWEGILIDPVGALLAVLVFEALLVGDFQSAPEQIALGVVNTILIGGGIGWFGAVFLTWILRRHLVPDFLENSFVLMIVVFFHVLSNHFHAESGLFAVTLMAIILANTKGISVQHILEFKEDLSVIIISSLFIILAANVTVNDISQLNITNGLLFVGTLIFIARPASVFLSTIGAGLSMKERLFLSWVAPRGIVAAAVSTVFGFELIKVGYPGSELLAPYTFMVIVGTVIVYGLTAGPIGRALGVAQKSPNGVLFLGGNKFSRALAKVLKEENIQVLIVDSNALRVREARKDKLPAHCGNLLAEITTDRISLEGLGQFVALTQNDEANSLAVLRCSEMFSRAHLYQIAQKDIEEEVGEKSHAKHLRGRFLFRKDINYDELERRIVAGEQIISVEIPEGFDKEVLDEKFGEDYLPLATIKDGVVSFISEDTEIVFTPPSKLIVLTPGFR